MKENGARAFLKRIFFVGMATTQRCEGYHSYLKRFVNVQQGLVDFVCHFSNSLQKAWNNEDYYDFITSQLRA